MNCSHYVLLCFIDVIYFTKVACDTSTQTDNKILSEIKMTVLSNFERMGHSTVKHSQELLKENVADYI